LEIIKAKADEEKEILDILSQKDKLNKIEIRACKNSFQVLIEALIGKSKKILKHFNCPIIPQRSKDAIYILLEVGAISEEEYKEFSSAIGFKNIMIHDYLEFDEKILYDMLKNKRYETVYNFLATKPNFNDTIISRIEKFTF
jgi:uncharacterized protein YutE (UPF0331/DUF86 family)